MGCLELVVGVVVVAFVGNGFGLDHACRYADRDYLLMIVTFHLKQKRSLI